MRKTIEKDHQPIFHCPLCGQKAKWYDDKIVNRYCAKCKHLIPVQVGRELKISDLRPGMLVVLTRPGTPVYTAWVTHVTPDWVSFSLEWMALHKKGQLHDERGQIGMYAIEKYREDYTELKETNKTTRELLLPVESKRPQNRRVAEKMVEELREGAKEVVEELIREEVEKGTIQ
jgi:hypothetical protein